MNWFLPKDVREKGTKNSWKNRKEVETVELKLDYIINNHV